MEDNFDFTYVPWWFLKTVSQWLPVGTELNLALFLMCYQQLINHHDIAKKVTKTKYEIVFYGAGYGNTGCGVFKGGIQNKKGF